MFGYLSQESQQPGFNLNSSQIVFTDKFTMQKVLAICSHLNTWFKCLDIVFIARTNTMIASFLNSIEKVIKNKQVSVGKTLELTASLWFCSVPTQWCPLIWCTRSSLCFCFRSSFWSFALLSNIIFYYYISIIYASVATSTFSQTTCSVNETHKTD